MRRLGWLGALTAVGGVIGMVAAPEAARLAIVPPLLLSLAVVWFVWRKEEKTAVGEIVAAAALSGAAFPVALAGGVALERAALSWVVWATAFFMATLAVRAVIARAKREGTTPLWVAQGATLGAAAASVFLATRSVIPMAAAIALTPFVVLSLAVCLVPVHTKHLRRVGWGLIGASVATLSILVVTLR